MSGELSFDEKYENNFSQYRGVRPGKQMFVLDPNTNKPVSEKVESCSRTAKKGVETKWDTKWEVCFVENGQKFFYTYPYWALFSSAKSCSRYWNK